MIPLKVVRLVKLVTPLGEALLFNRLEGSDGLSRNGEYRVTVLSRRPDIKGDELLGKSVSVKVTTPRAGLREFNGLAVGFYQVGQQGRYHQYLIVVRPWTWLLTRTSDCKIFQDKTVRQIIEAVLADHPYADFEFQLAGQYTPWDYCVQYRETDFNFVSRLMEQEGITDEMLGSNHVFYLPYLMGERSPHNNPLARATFTGMTMDTTRTDMTQAVLEGVGTTFPQTEEILNNGICHGRSGIMLLFNLMYLDTGKIQFKTISDNLFREIVRAASNSEYIFVESDVYFRGVNFDKVIDYIDFGLLNGVSGIVLALMAQKTGASSPLDRMFFMQ